MFSIISRFVETSEFRIQLHVEKDNGGPTQSKIKFTRQLSRYDDVSTSFRTE